MKDSKRFTVFPGVVVEHGPDTLVVDVNFIPFAIAVSAIVYVARRFWRNR